MFLDASAIIAIVGRRADAADACAGSIDKPFLFKGDDFPRTDIIAA
jgi:uncharacterized protein with PIN domain